TTNERRVWSGCILPAGSGVRLKSRFFLYWARDPAEDARGPAFRGPRRTRCSPLAADFLAIFFALNFFAEFVAMARVTGAHGRPAPLRQTAEPTKNPCREFRPQGLP